MMASALVLLAILGVEEAVVDDNITTVDNMTKVVELKDDEVEKQEEVEIEAVEDPEAQCALWAGVGECLKNPQFMFAGERSKLGHSWSEPT